jgi:hypothetical protein
MEYINVWADGSWCFDSELSEMKHRSDDVTRVAIPDGACDEQMDELAMSAVS